MRNSESENRALSRITLVTNFGDFLSFFAVLQWLSTDGIPAVILGYSVVLKTIAIGLSGALLPTLLTRVSTRTLIRWTQIFSFLLSAGLLGIFLTGLHPVVPIFLIFFGLCLLKQLFEGARESHSHGLAAPEQQLTFQAQLMTSFYSAQFVGPILSYFLIRFLPLWIPLALDTISFAFAAVISLSLRIENIFPSRIHVFRPLKYLWTHPPLRDIFLMRSVGFWFSIGLFNYLLFTVVTEFYHLPIIDSAWIYAVMGLGATLASLTLRRNLPARFTREGLLAFGAQIVFALMILLFWRLPKFSDALAALFVLGAAMGVNAVATQSIRRKVTRPEEFPEVMGLELIFGRASDALISTIAQWTLITGMLKPEAWLGVSAAALVALAFLHLRFLKSGALHPSARLHETT